MSRVREGTVIAAKYRIERSLARGGMGSIWVARHLQLDMPVAVKFMDGQFAATPDGRARFEREARAIGMIQSPNVVHVHDYGIHDGAPYMAMELLRGEDLGTRIRREQRLSVQVTADLLGQACKALRKAHEAGIIHRDLKPANVFLVREEDEEIVKVLDFGVAKMIGLGEAGDATRTGMVIGSVHYMSPEQARGSKDLDQRADLWSIGIIAFRALTGQLPFPGDQVGDVIVKICSEPIPQASSFRPDLGPGVDAFFARALARRPDERFQNARELGAALAALAGQAPSRVDVQLGQGLEAQVPMGDFAPPRGDGGAGPITQSSLSLGATPAPISSLSATPTPPIWQGPPLGTITHATQSSDIQDGGAPRGVGLPAVMAVAAVCGVVLVAGGMALFGGARRSGAAPVETASAALPEASAAPSVAPTASQVASVAPPASVTPPAPPAERVIDLPEPPAPSATPSATAAPAAKAPASRAPSQPAKPRKINSELGF
jgi:serine/threonine-protein kinase